MYEASQLSRETGRVGARLLTGASASQLLFEEIPGQLSMLSHAIRRAREDNIPSVESTIVPSKSESTPSKVRTSAGAEKDPAAVEVMVGEGRAGICSDSQIFAGGETCIHNEGRLSKVVEYCKTRVPSLLRNEN